MAGKTRHIFVKRKKFHWFLLWKERKYFSSSSSAHIPNSSSFPSPLTFFFLLLSTSSFDASMWVYKSAISRILDCSVLKNFCGAKRKSLIRNMLLITFVHIVLKGLWKKFLNFIYHNSRVINVEIYFNVYYGTITLNVLTL